MTGSKKSDWAGCDVGRRLMYNASEKLAIIRLVEDSELSVRRTLPDGLSGVVMLQESAGSRLTAEAMPLALS